MQLPVALSFPDRAAMDFDIPGKLPAEWHVRGPLVRRTATQGDNDLSEPRVSIVVFRVPRTGPTAPELKRLYDLAGTHWPGVDLEAPPWAVDQPLDAGEFDTFVAVATQLALSSADVERDVIQACLLRCVAAINRVITAHAVTVDKPTDRPLSVGNIAWIALMASWPWGSPEQRSGPAFVLPRTETGPIGVMTPEGWDLFKANLSVIALGQPFMIPERLHLAARANFDAAGYASAVLLAATASEVLLNTTLRALIIEESPDLPIGVEQARTCMAMNPGLTKRLRSEYGRRLGGAWRLSGTGPVAAWVATAWRLRGRVVHGGYEPDRVEAINALSACETLDEFINKRLVDRRFQFPKTALSKRGMAGMQQAGVMSGRLEEVAASLESTILPFWAAIREAASDDAEDS